MGALAPNSATFARDQAWITQPFLTNSVTCLIQHWARRQNSLRLCHENDFQIEVVRPWPHMDGITSLIETEQPPAPICRAAIAWSQWNISPSESAYCATRRLVGLSAGLRKHRYDRAPVLRLRSGFTVLKLTRHDSIAGISR